MHMAVARTPLAALRNPEYTGENRCLPCTAVNLVIAAVLGLAIGFVFWPPAGAAALVACVAAIYFRGYLIPGTPALTKQYFPDWLLRRFDKRPEPPTADGDVDVEAALVEAGALTDCPDVDDLCLDAGFRTAWHDRIAAVREREDGRRALVDILDVDADRLTFETHGDDARVAYVDDVRVARWASPAAFIADVAAAETLADQYSAWPSASVPAKGQLLAGLRLFLETCPACGGAVRFGTDTVESCCREVEVVAVTCEDCGSRIFEADAPEA